MDSNDIMMFPKEQIFFQKSQCFFFFCSFQKSYCEATDDREIQAQLQSYYPTLVGLVWAGLFWLGARMTNTVILIQIIQTADLSSFFFFHFRPVCLTLLFHHGTHRGGCRYDSGLLSLD